MKDVPVIYRRLLSAAVTCLIISALSYAGQHPSLPQTPDRSQKVLQARNLEGAIYLPDRVIVKVAGAVGFPAGQSQRAVSTLQRIASMYAGSSIHPAFPHHATPDQPDGVDLTRYHIIRFAGPVDVLRALDELAQTEGVEYAEPCFIYPVDACRPNDPSRGSQYGLDKILADSAWCVSTGDTTVVIGIIDTGIQLDHADLSNKIWINPGEDGSDGLGGSKRTNGIDDDGNGKIDDWRGWDFGGANYAAPTEDNLPVPTAANNAHGTHVAGIAAASTNNGVGVAGAAYNCRLMPVKVTSDNDARGSGGTPYVVFGFEGIVYATDMGADIINCSWGGTGGSLFEQDIISYATQHGALVVAAAGNVNTTIPDYPAAYDGVLSVAATTSNDVKASYSKHGITIDLAAPGDLIYSTYYPNLYQTMSGTSMASPLVAGVAALVKSMHPTYTGLQVGEQVRITADAIGSINPNYLLGKGRLNAYRALTESSPSLRMTDIDVLDFAGGRQNGYPEPGESLAITVTIRNYLAPTSPAAKVTLRSTSAYITIADSLFQPGSVSTLQEVTNGSAPFKMRVATNVPPASLATMMLILEDGAYSDVQYFTILINPTFGIHTVNNVTATLVNNGRIGFSDLTNSAGTGIVFRNLNHLYEGGIIVGTSSTKLLDVIRNLSCATCQDLDFASPGLYELSETEPNRQDGRTTFLDSIASLTNRIGLTVRMSSYAFTTPDDSNYVLVQYDLHNTSTGTDSNLYVGLFFDWDVQNYTSNKTGFDASRNLGYVWDTAASSPVYIGTAALEGVGSFRGLSNSTALAIDRTEKWNWISGGIVTPQATGDIHTVISSGPYRISPGGTQTVAFAIIAGNTLASVQSSAEFAQAKWDSLKPTVGVPPEHGGIPAAMHLYQNYPNPFNPTTVIRYDVSEAQRVSLRLYDVLGRELETLVDAYQPAGTYSVTLDASTYAAGIYLCRLTGGERSEVMKLVLVK